MFGQIIYNAEQLNVLEKSDYIYDNILCLW